MEVVEGGVLDAWYCICFLFLEDVGIVGWGKPGRIVFGSSHSSGSKY